MADTILLVDDEEDIRDILKLTLTDRGYSVLTAENGAQGLKLFKEHRPPIVISDIKMPGMDGITLLEKIKNEDPDAEIIMITGHGDMNLAINSFRREAVEFIVKPIDINTLDSALKKVHEKISIRDQLRQYTGKLETMVHDKAVKIREIEQRLESTGKAEDLVSEKGGFNELFDDLPFYITLQNRDLVYEAMNLQFRKDFGDDSGRHCYQVRFNEDNPCENCPVLNTFETGRSCQGEMELSNAEKEKFNVFYWTAPVRDANDRITHVMMMMTNMLQILQSHDHLASLGLMISTVSHGIKGLLTGLDGGLYLIESGLNRENPDTAREGLAIVKRLIENIRRMVLDILFYAKDRDLKFEPVDVGEFAEDLAATVEKKIKDHDIALEKQFSPDCGTIEIDENYLHTAMVNILDNAVDACIEDRGKESLRIEFKAYPEDDRVVFEINDNGVGMDEKTQNRIFSLFYSAKGKKGTGLGLFVTNHIIGKHGGDIHVESAPGEGTRFSIRIPKQRPD